MANIKISELPAASAASTTQEFEVNDSGTSKKVTGSQIKSFVKSGLVLTDITDVTASVTELNVLDGITATTAELNQLRANDFTDISVKAGGGTEGGQINIRNPGNTTTGLVIDVSSADTGRIFSSTNNFRLDLGQLGGGTNGTISLFTAGQSRLAIDGSGNVTGSSIATQAEATAGTATGKLMTPERVAQAITARVSAPTTAQVLGATAGANTGDVGTYAFFSRTSMPITAGTNYAGSTLRYGAVFVQTGEVLAMITNTNTTPTGTWKAMGAFNATSGANTIITLFLRIA